MNGISPETPKGIKRLFGKWFGKKENPIVSSGDTKKVSSDRPRQNPFPNPSWK